MVDCRSMVKHLVVEQNEITLRQRRTHYDEMNEYLNKFDRR